jgi:parvulin-like peptidyl-prolyl isomerase
LKSIIGGLCVGLFLIGGCASRGDRQAPANPGSGFAGAPVAPNSADGAARPGSAAAPGAGGAVHSQVMSSFAADDQAVASIGGRTITMAQFLTPLVESHGLNTLLHLVQLELARQAAEQKRIPVGPQDVAAERERTLRRLFENSDEKTLEKIEQAKKDNKPDEVKALQKEMEDEHDQLLNQFLTQQNITPGEFELLMQTNTYLRKVAQPLLDGKVTEEMLRKEFGVQYNEKVRVRHIQVERKELLEEVKRRLDMGQDFGTVAAEFSTNKQTAVLKGELPPFNRDDQRLPQHFKDVAFALKVGEVSQAVQVEDSFHLIKLEERIMPRAAKFEQVRDSLYRDLHERLTLAVMKELREDIGREAREKLQIAHPVLKRQWDERMAARNTEVQSRQKAMEAEAKRQRDRIEAVRAQLKNNTTRPATQPAGANPAAPATQPAAPVQRLVPVGITPQAAPPAAAPTTAPAKG